MEGDSQRVKSEEQRKPEHGFLTTCLCGPRSYRAPVGYCNPEFRFLAIGTCYQVGFAASVRIVSESFWSYLRLEAQSFWISEKASQRSRF